MRDVLLSASMSKKLWAKIGDYTMKKLGGREWSNTPQQLIELVKQRLRIKLLRGAFQLLFLAGENTIMAVKNNNKMLPLNIFHRIPITRLDEVVEGMF